MSGYFWGWAVWLVAGAAYEVWAVWGRKTPGDTLSEFTARVFRSSTTVGFAALTALLTFLLLWFPIHTRRFDRRLTLVTTKETPMFTLGLWKATAERAVSTAAQAALLVLGADQIDALEADWRLVSGFALGGAALAVLKCLAVNSVGKPGPSAIGAEVPTDRVRILGKALVANPSDSTPEQR